MESRCLLLRWRFTKAFVPLYLHKAPFGRLMFIDRQHVAQQLTTACDVMWRGAVIVHTCPEKTSFNCRCIDNYDMVSRVCFALASPIEGSLRPSLGCKGPVS